VSDERDEAALDDREPPIGQEEGREAGESPTPPEPQSHGGVDRHDEQATGPQETDAPDSERHESASDAEGATEPPLASASAELKSILEALIFASPDPLTRKALAKLLASEPAEDIDAALQELKRDYERPGGLQLVEVAGGYQIVTRSDLHEWVRRLFQERSTQKLTVAALETLAVIAYKQPITALEITEIRGVNTSGVLNTLLERHLIKIVGRKKVVGRPFLYATTKEFLIRFGLNDLGDLPKVEDMAEALGIDEPLLVEQSPTEEALPLDEPEHGEPADETDPSGSVH
jgi:segregation and condensation protein B